MSVRLVWNGLSEFKAALRTLPEELTGEASRIVEGAANGAAADIKQAYTVVKTGNLRDGLIVTHVDRGKYHAGAVVKNLAKHSHLYEYGTEMRHTDAGWSRGRMPPKPTFVPRVIRARARMYEALADMLRRHGLTVSGRP